MAWHLAAIARTQPNVNATVIGDRKYVYDDVNVGLAVQGGSRLYLVVVPRADQLSARACCDRVTELQRRAIADSLTAREISGATIALTSMARWNVSRHIPVLPPYTSVIIAHSAASNGEATLGATYDHRLLTGADVVMLLDRLARAPEQAESSKSSEPSQSSESSES
jgi:pyruvate/2-oxoglutarate dehydrogenase complex dihydrolipoamide acyltransferase (E2) component